MVEISNDKMKQGVLVGVLQRKKTNRTYIVRFVKKELAHRITSKSQDLENEWARCRPRRAGGQLQSMSQRLQ